MAPLSSKMSGKMVALCSAAIGVVYSTGYFLTMPTAAEAETPGAATAAAAPVPAPRQQGEGQGFRGHNRYRGGGEYRGDREHEGGREAERDFGGDRESFRGQMPGTAAPATPAPSSATMASGKYKDGTFVGTGSDRIGSITVAVTIKSNKITDVRITKITTHYSPRYVADMPQQVIARQSAQVDFVSGATRSSRDFQTAVEQAMAQAKV